MLRERVTKHIKAYLSPFRNQARPSRSERNSAQSSTTDHSPTADVSATPLLLATPHPVSNIRVFKVISDPAETQAVSFNTTTCRANFADQIRFSGTSLALQWERTQLWHHQYWESNNLELKSQMADFEHNVHTLFGRTPSDEELSQFYREYLEVTRARHAEYNRQLWKQNFSNLLPALNSEISTFDRRAGAFIFERPIGLWNEGRARWRDFRSAGSSMLTIYKDGDTYGHRAQGVSVR
ncbi:hypothetical protein BJ742DRAFT_354878 [Cladochytrium replicatum]|nr:hypothetical protein BJ742DRAFT_354878 [Cladochytrium replicatum]